MKYLMLVMLMGAQAYAYNSSDLVCNRETDYSSRAVAVSCVSKASIDKDKAQLRLIKLQMKKLEMELGVMGVNTKEIK